MRQIKPLRKKRCFVNWLKKVFGIKNHFVELAKDADEMHSVKDDYIYQCIMRARSGNIAEQK